VRSFKVVEAFAKFDFLREIEGGTNVGQAHRLEKEFLTSTRKEFAVSFDALKWFRSGGHDVCIPLDVEEQTAKGMPRRKRWDLLDFWLLVGVAQTNWVGCSTI
jgi:hypothetical protein